MAISYRDVKLKSDKKLEKKQDKRQQFRAVITDQFGNQSGAGDVWFNRSQRKVWAMPNGGTQPFPYNCFRIKPVIGLGVIIGYSSPLNQLPEVLQTDTEFLGPSNTTGTAYESPDNEDFLPGGRLQLWLDTRLIQSLAIYPDATGLFVNVTNGDYIYAGERKTFDGETNIDLSGSQPVGPNEHLYVGLYLDSSNLLQTVDGATVATSSDAPQPTWPDGSYRLGMVLLDDTQTSFSMADDVVNLKIPWTDEESFGTGAWPNAGEIKIGDTIYATLADAQAVAVSPDVVKLGEGSYLSNNLIFATGVSMASAGNATITQTNDANCLTLTNATIRDINFSVSINSANTRSALTFIDTCYAYNVRISGSNAGAGVIDGFTYADGFEVYLGDCESIVDGKAVVINNIDAIVTIANGIYSGGVGGITVTTGIADLLFPHVTSDNVTAFPVSRGQWFDSDSQIKIETDTVTTPVDTDKILLSDTDFSFGLNWVTWANIKATLKAYFDTIYEPIFSILPISKGGTNSGTALSNNRVMRSSTGAIVEAAAITASRALISDANGIPTHATTTSTEIGFVNGVTSAIQTQLDARIAKAFLDAKGDLITATANDTPSILSAGTDGKEVAYLASSTNGILGVYPLGANYTIAVSVATNDLTVALKTLGSSDASVSDPIRVRIGDTLQNITAALSTTKNDGTNWCNSGGNELKTLDVDYFCYLIQETGASAGTKIGFSRIPWATVMGDFSGTSTNETYIAGNWTNKNATDAVALIGRFNAILSGTAAFNWSLTTQVIINRPILETRWLTYTPALTSQIGTFTTTGAVAGSYQVSYNKLFFNQSGTITTNGTGAGSVQLSLPFTPQTDYSVVPGRENALTGSMLQGRASAALVQWFTYNNAYPGGDGAQIHGGGIAFRLI